MDYRKLLTGFAVILLVLLVVNAIGGATQTTIKDIQIDLSTEKSKGTILNDYNNLDYSVKCDTNTSCELTLNKLIYDNNKCVKEAGNLTCGKAVIGSVFNNKKVVFSVEQTCLDWNKYCSKYSVPECLEWEVRPLPVCLKWEDEKKINCLEWEVPKGCKEFDYKLGVCLKWEEELKCLKYSIPECLEYDENCLKWTSFSKEDFIEQALTKEVKKVISVSQARKDTNTLINDYEGKVLIK